MSTTKPFSQWTVIALREFLKERGVRSSGLKAQLVDLAQQYCSDVFDPNPANCSRFAPLRSAI
jgi:hypothetical protein